jgi:Winged helix DNA-binding domain
VDAATIARRRLGATRLTGPGFPSAEEAVGWHLAMQAQDYAPAKWSVGQRSRGLHDEDLDRALTEGTIVRTHVLRPTWHFVARDDLRWLLALSGPRVQQKNARRYRELGLDGRARARAEKLIVAALADGERLTRNELGEALDRGRFDRSGQRLPYLLAHCELEAVVGSGGLAGKQQTYALLEGRVPAGRRLDRDEALVELTRRYLQSHGPASVSDLSWWSGLTIRDVRSAIEGLGGEVGSEVVDGLTLWSLSGRRSPPAEGGIDLLQAYDELIVGYRESRYLGDPRAEGARIAWRDRTLPSGVIFLDGRIAGHWTRRVDRDTVRIEALLYEPRRRGVAAKVDAAAQELAAFFGRPVDVTISPVPSELRLATGPQRY